MLEGLFLLLMTPAVIKVVAAVLPAAYLLKYVYKTDRLEPEPPELLKGLVLVGMLSTIPAVILETLGDKLIMSGLPSGTIGYNFVLYFGIVAYAEEGAKYYFLKRKTWNNPNFNCRYDGVVYAVFVSLGFALLENIEYVFMYGLSVALARALTAIPGHMCFSVYMGVFYGAAKKSANDGNHVASRTLRILSVVVPAVIHGAYDFIATVSQSLGFIVFVGVLFYLSFGLIKKSSNNDTYI